MTKILFLQFGCQNLFNWVSLKKKLYKAIKIGKPIKSDAQRIIIQGFDIHSFALR